MERLSKNKNELEVILNDRYIDVCLLSETHLMNHSYLKFLNYELYHTPHPANSAREGSAEERSLD